MNYWKFDGITINSISSVTLLNITIDSKVRIKEVMPR